MTRSRGGPFVAVGNHAPAWLARLLGPVSPVSRVARPIVNRLVPDVPTTVSVRSGLAAGSRIAILPRREKFYWTGAHETEVQEALSRILQPGDTFWDVGAHIGFFSLIAARLVGSSGAVHAFEPFALSAARLHQTLQLNELRNVRVHNEALGATRGPSMLYAGASPLESTLKAEFGGGPSGIVDCTTIDNRARDIGIPSAIKIDVEGAEVDVLRGGVSVLSGDPLPSLVVEFTNRALLDSARALLPHYAFERLTQRHWLLEPIDGQQRARTRKLR